jgi:hypothetical protein
VSDRYSEPNRDIILVAILLVVSSILLAISMAGLFLWLPTR